MLKIVNHNLFEVLAPSDPTLYPCKGKPSTVDLAFRKNIYCTSDLNTINDLSSDHLPVVFQIDSQFSIKTDKVYDFARADWKKFRSIINSRLPLDSPTNENLPSSTSKEIDEKVDVLSNAIKLAAEKSIPKKRPYKFRYPSSHLIDNLKKSRNMYRNLFKSSHNSAYKSCINQLNRMIKVHTVSLNQKAWEEKIAKLDHKDHTIFHMTKSLKNRKRIIPPIHKENDVLVYNDQDKAQEIAENFKKSHNISSQFSSPFEHNVQTSINSLNSQENSFNNANILDKTIIISSISKLKIRKAPGPDGISNIFIKNLPERAVEWLVEIFNDCLRVGYFPKIWKIAKIIPIPKPGKDPVMATSYRPISLLNCLGKLFEKIVSDRFLQFLEENQIIVNHQFGFRRNHSTVHQILRLTEKISLDFNQDLSSAMVTLDVEKAFDSVWHDGLIFKLIQINCPIYLIKLAQSFITDRSCFVQINDSKSLEYLIEAGVPQGSNWAPLLYSTYLYDIPTPSNCDEAIFADDTALKTKSGRHGIKIIKKNLEKGLLEVKNYFDSWKIKINPQKTEAIMFTHSRILRREMQKPENRIKFQDTYLEWKSSIRYLGVLLDSKLIYRENIENNIKKAKKAISFLYPLLKKHNSLNIKTKLVLYKSYILPLLTYACPVWINTAKTHMNKIQVMQNKCLRMVHSAPYSTRIADLHKKFKVPYVYDYIKELTRKFYDKVKFIENPLIKNLGNYCSSSINFRIKHKLPKKI